MKLLPSTKSAVLRWTIVVLSAGCIWLAFRGIRLAVEGAYFDGVLAIALWCPLALGLWMVVPVARVVAKALLWFILFIIPLGAVNPFAAMDELGPYPPSVRELLLFRVAPWVLPSIFGIHVLGKYKAEFRWPRKAAT